MQRYNDTHEDIERVLDELVTEGCLVKKNLPDNKVIYACSEKPSSDK